jgi:hypothetical protein
MQAAAGSGIAGFEGTSSFETEGLDAHYWIRDRGMRYSKGPISPGLRFPDCPISLFLKLLV